MASINKKSILRSKLAGFFLILALSSLIFRLYFLQYVCYGHLSKKARAQHSLKLSLDSSRGEIYDRKGRTLALTIPVMSLFAVPYEIENSRDVAKKLNAVLDIAEEPLLQKLLSSKKFVWIHRKIPVDVAERIRLLGLKGIYFKHEVQRFYANGTLLSHVLGMVGMDDVGLEGIELFADESLQGKPGMAVSEKDSRGREILVHRANRVAPLNGYSVVLTIDEVIQYIAEAILDRAYRQHNARGASVIVMDPQSGEILALANRPTFNPNRFQDYSPDHRRNRAITDQYEPGSVFKIVTASAILNEGIVNLNETFNCENGAFLYRGHTLHDAHSYQTLTFQEIIERSSNIGTVKLAMRLGADVLYNYITRFGFGTKTGVDLRGEITGLVRAPDDWSGISIIAVPIGQEIAVTPLQIVCAMSCIANDGILMKPKLIKRIIDADGNVVEHYPDVRVRRVISSEADAKMKTILQGVVSKKGTAPRAAIPGYTVAGKTGTAQKADLSGRGRGYAHGKFVSTFVGFVPVKNPRICIIVMFDEPKPQYYGGLVAAPVFREIGVRVLKYLDVPPDGVGDDVKFAALW